MEKKYSLRQMSFIVAAAVILSVCITSVAFYLIYTWGTRYIISFDADSVQYENVVKFNEVRKIIKDDYYLEVDENKLLEGAIGGLAASLKDPYTVYFDKDQMKRFLEKSEGSYVGIGVTVNADENGLLTIVEPFKNSPAEQAGIKKGDKIVRVDDTDVTDIKDENMVISMIKGKENTKVKLTVYRPDEDKYINLEVTRKRIKMSNIESEILEGDIGYIKLTMFDSEIAKYFKDDLQKLMKKGIKGLIIDLRDNPGGSYEQVVEIADRMIGEGMIVYTEDRAGKKEVKMSDKAGFDLPLAILINGNSASASEILAGAVKDNEAGVLVGTRTFGKGLVQELRMLKDGSGIKVTISKYFTPSGVCIHGVGIKPDIEIELPADYRNVPASRIPRSQDSQLKAAIDVIKGK